MSNFLSISRSTVAGLSDMTFGGMGLWLESGAQVASNRVRAPIFNVGDDITISSSTTGATIYYTTDGSTPDETDTEYTEPITLPEEDTTIKAIAIKADMDDSAVRTFTYTIPEQWNPWGTWGTPEQWNPWGTWGTE